MAIPVLFQHDHRGALVKPVQKTPEKTPGSNRHIRHGFWSFAASSTVEGGVPNFGEQQKWWGWIREKLSWNILAYTASTSWKIKVQEALDDFYIQDPFLDDLALGGQLGFFKMIFMIGKLWLSPVLYYGCWGLYVITLLLCFGRIIQYYIIYMLYVIYAL